MPASPLEPKSGGGLWGRVWGAKQADAAADDEMLPDFDAIPQGIPIAAPVTGETEPSGIVPVAIPIASPIPIAEAVPDEVPIAEAPPVAIPVPPPAETPAPPPQLCSYCQTPRSGDSQYCYNCGLMFPERVETPTATSAAAPIVDTSKPSERIAGRYELLDVIATRGDVKRFRAIDHADDGGATPVIVLQSPFTAPTVAPENEDAADSPEEDTAEEVAAPAKSSDSLWELELGIPSDWPTIGWEWRALQMAEHPSLPSVLSHIVEDSFFYLIESVPAGTVLWDAWDDPAATPTMRYEWLAQVAEGLKALHTGGAILEGIRPELVTVTGGGRAIINDLSDLLPIPLPPNPPVKATLYTAPELVLASETADARSDLYSFGAMLYALFLGRELSEMDFERQGVPKAFALRFPDVHPGLARVIMKTFVRELDRRFPSDEAIKQDATGFTELISVLRHVGKTLSRARLDIASWTTTGMSRTGNEDAFALIHSAGSRQDDMGERALIILADGMGGAEAGEVASAMAIDSLRHQLLKQRIFHGILHDSSIMPIEFDVPACMELLAKVIRDTNQEIHTASRTPGKGKRGMGCTVEAVYIDGQRLVVGHVGDSRTYHYTGGQLKQITRDQTLVNRLVELGQLSADEAENHPRKNELQQALGGQPFVDPGTYSAEIHPGDWVIVCSDGLINHVDHATLTEMIQRADSAEMCARRLVNLANIQGGSDNTTVVAIRAT